MNLPVTRHILLTALIVFSMLGPKLSAAGSQLLGLNNQTIIICTGDGLREIILNSEGNPASESEVLSDLCVQSSLEAGPIAAAMQLVPFSPPEVHRLPIAGLIWQEKPYSIRSALVRAPPVIV